MVRTRDPKSVPEKTSLVTPWLWRGLAKGYCNMDYKVNLKDY